MNQEKPKTEVKERKTKRKELAYTESGKEIFSSSIGIGRRFLKLIDRFDHTFDAGKNDVGKTLEDGDLKITFLQNLYSRHIGSSRALYKVSFGDNDYFVKEIYGEEHGGAQELKKLMEAKQLLKANGIDWAEVIDYKLGYSDKDKSYYVAAWDEYLWDTNKTRNSFNYRLKTLNLPPEEEEDVKSKYSKLESLLHSQNFYDTQYNISYDPKKKKLIIYDLVKHAEK